MALPKNLIGSFVVEVGERPFVGFCDNRTTPPTEVRLYIDSEFQVLGGGTLLDLMMLTVEGTEVGIDASLRVLFDGERTLTISGTPSADTVGDVWWLARP